MHILITVRSRAIEYFLGDRILIYSWSHTTRNSFGTLAAKQIRYGGAMNISMFVNLEKSDYQQDLRGLNPSNRKT